MHMQVMARERSRRSTNTEPCTGEGCPETATGSATTATVLTQQDEGKLKMVLVEHKTERLTTGKNEKVYF